MNNSNYYNHRLSINPAILYHTKETEERNRREKNIIANFTRKIYMLRGSTMKGPKNSVKRRLI